MDIIITIIVFVFGILQIILFFKIWGMTNDVAEMLQIMKNKNNNASLPLQPKAEPSHAAKSGENTTEAVEHPSEKVSYDYNVGDTVYYFKKELIIARDNGDGTYACNLPNGNKYDDSIEGSKLKSAN